MSASLVGSEMCIRDSVSETGLTRSRAHRLRRFAARARRRRPNCCTDGLKMSISIGSPRVLEHSPNATR
eukprot:15163447-Alexandrium_andersonii.AAC.1